MAAIHLKYPDGCSDEKRHKIKDKTLRANKDTLFCDERRGERYALSFYSTMVREWIGTMKTTYPNLEEKKHTDRIQRWYRYHNYISLCKGCGKWPNNGGF